MMFLNAKDFAKEVNLPYRTVKALCRSGVIPTIKAGRVYNVPVEEAKQALVEHSAKEVTCTTKKNYMMALKKLSKGA